jgi:hypothetical protein
MKAWGSGGIAPPFFTLALDGDEWSASYPSPPPLEGPKILLDRKHHRDTWPKFCSFQDHSFDLFGNTLSSTRGGVGVSE